MSPRFAFTPLPPTRSDLGRPSALAALAGTWRGELVRSTGERQAFTLLRDASSDAAVNGRFLFFVTRNVSPTGVKLLEAGDQAFVALIGPYYLPEEDAEVITVLEGRRASTGLSGTWYCRLYGRRDVLAEGTFTATRADTTHRAA